MNRLRKNVWCLQGNEVLHRHILVHEIGRLTGCNFDDSYIFIVKNIICVWQLQNIFVFQSSGYIHRYFFFLTAARGHVRVN